MKQKTLLKQLLFLCLLVVGGVNSVFAAEKTLVYSVDSKTSVTLQNTSTGSFSGTVTFANSGSNNNDQMTSGNTMTLTLASFPYIVTKVSLNLKRNSSRGGGTVSIKHNDNTIGSGTKNKGDLTSSYTNYDFTCTDNQTEGNLVVLLTSTENSFWCNKFTITYEDTPAKTLSSIAVTTQPSKTAYKIGDGFDFSDMVVTGTYSDESTNTIDNYTMKIGDDAIQNGDVLSSAGNKTVTIAVGEITTTVDITVASVTGLAVKTAPTKVKYRIGDNLDLTDLVLTATYSDEGTKDINTGFTASPTDGSALNTAGNIDVTLNYYDQSCTQRVTVGNLSSISYNATGEGEFANTTYTENETFNPDGLVVTAHFDNDLDDVVATGYTLTPDAETELKTTDKNVTVSYTWNEVEKTVNIPITVNALPKYTVTFADDSSTETQASGGASVTLPSRSAIGSYTFAGWCTTNVASETTTAPSSILTESYTPTDNITLYPVYNRTDDSTPDVIDVLDSGWTGISENSYSVWYNMNAPSSSAIYAGKCAGNYSTIQLRTSDNSSGIVTTSSGGKVKKITITWDSNTTAGRKVDVYGKNSAYSAATDLYSADKQGTKLGTISYDNNEDLTITGDYDYIGLRSYNGALYLTDVSITWSNSTTYYVSTPSASVTANEGATGEYWATYYNNDYNVIAPSGTKVFAVKLTDSEIEMTEIADGIVTKGQGVVLKASSANITMTVNTSASAGDYSDNSLTGTMTSTTNPGNAYVLNKKTAGVGFYKLSEGGTIGANKAYLTYSGANAREFFLFGETSGINATLMNNKDVNGDVYDLQGRRVSQPTKGLYIVNGKKYIKK